MKASLGMFYDRILAAGLDRIPDKGGALLIANHPSSLMDAAILGILLKRPVHFFARGDIFVNRFVTSILNRLHMHPLHHHRDGRHTIRLNDASIEKAIQLLAEGELVLFFPEGISHTEYHLRPFKKGAVRIAFQTLSLHPALPSLPIIPIGINYSHPTHLFSRVWVNAGAPLYTETLLGLYRQQPSAAIKQLTAQVFEAVQELIPDSRSLPPKPMFQALEIWRNDRETKERFGIEQIRKELTIAKSYPEWYEPSLAPLTKYAGNLEQQKTTDKAIAGTGRKKLSATPLLMGFPAAFIGWVLNALPLLVARNIADKKVSRIDFYSWVLVVLAALLYLFWFILVMLCSFLLLPDWKALALLFITISTGQYAWNYFSYYREWRQQQSLQKLPAALVQELQDLRKAVLEILPEK